MINKFIALLLTLCLVTVLIPGFAVSAEIPNYFFEDFNDGSTSNFSSFLSNTDSGQTGGAVYALEDIDEQNKALVLDTSDYEGQEYPIRASNGTVSYPRADFNVITNTALAETNVFFFEIDLKFDDAFALTRYGARLGSFNWVDGTTADIWFFEVRADGRLYVGNTYKTLNLGQTYKIGAGLDLRGNNLINEVYVDGEYLGTSSVAIGSSGADRKKVFKSSVVSYPHTSATPRTYIKTKITLDNVAVYDYNPYNIFNMYFIPDTRLYKPSEGETYYRFKTTSDEGANIEYSLLQSYTGVSITADGLLTLTPDISASDITVAVTETTSDITKYAHITINQPIVFNFENEEENTMPAGWSSSSSQKPYIKADMDGETVVNKYLYCDVENSRVSRSISPAINQGTITIEYDTVLESTAVSRFTGVLAPQTGNWNTYFTIEKANGEAVWKTNIQKDGSVAASVIYAHNLDQWVNVKLSVNYDTRKFSLIIDGIKVVDGYSLRAGEANYVLNSFQTYSSIDNFKFYSGYPLSESSVEISAPSSVLKPMNDDVAMIKLEALVSGEATDVHWELSGSPSNPVTVTPEGYMTYTKNTANSNYIIKAEIVPGTGGVAKGITVTSGYFNNFESYSAGAKPSSPWDNRDAFIEAEGIVGDGTYNQFYDAKSSAVQARYTRTSIATGIVTVSFRAKLPSSYGGGTAVVFSSSSGPWYIQNNFEKLDSSSFQFSSLYDKEGINNVQRLSIENLDAWHDLEYILNYDIGTYSVNLNGRPVICDFKFRAGETIDFNSIVFMCPVDDFSVYTGKNAFSITSSNNVLLVPPQGEATQYTLSIESPYYPQWELKDEYPGVSINPDTGILTVTDSAQAGEIYIQASSGALSDEYKAVIYKELYDFEDGTQGEKYLSWPGDALVASEQSGNSYLFGSSETTARYNFPKNLDGRIVIRAKIKHDSELSELGQIGVAIYDDNEWVVAQSIYASGGKRTFLDNHNKYAMPNVDISQDWVDYEIIIDTDERTYTTIINGKIYGITEIPARYMGKEWPLRLRQLVLRQKVDDLYIYHATVTTPLVQEVVIENPAVGAQAKAKYVFFDRRGVNTDCSGYRWYIGETAYGEFTQISEATQKAFTPTADMLGKYLKCAVTPANGVAIGEDIFSPAALVVSLGVYDAQINVNGNNVADSLTRYIEVGENEVDVIIPYENKTSEQTSIILGIMVFSENSLVGFRVIKHDVGANDSDYITESISFDAQQLHGNYYIKIVTWRDFTDIYPYRNAVIVN